MTRPITLGDFIDLDKHLEIFHSKHPYKNGVKHIECMIMNTYGEGVLFHYALEGQEMRFTFDDVIRLIDSPTYLEHPTYSAIRIVNEIDKEKHEDIQAIFVVNPISDQEIIIAAWLVTLDYHTAMIHREKYLQDFEFHYFENLMHHLQMVMINYEKLYYIIDVYTELLMSKDRFMPYHMTNVANWCMQLAAEINLPAKDQLILYVAALIHDIGKLFISDELINRQGKLENFEYNILKQHPERGYQMAIASLYGMTFFQKVPDVIRHHHERFDGEGYPFGLSGAAIPYLSRMLNLCDSVDAMMSRRSYKAKFGIDEILSELTRCAGTQFDPLLTQHMIKLLMEHTTQKADISISNTHFIPQASLNFFYRDIKTQHSITGNLVVKDGKGKLIVHNALLGFEQLEIESIHRCTLSYYQLTNFIEFSVDVEGILKDQMYISNIKPVPTDKYFSTTWDGLIIVNGLKSEPMTLNLVKVGGDSVVFEANGHQASILEENHNDIFVGLFNLSIEEVQVNLKVDLKIVKFYNFSGQSTFVAKYMNIASADRDRIIRMLFKKQMQLKHLKKEALRKKQD